MENKLKILFVEDLPTDVELTKRTLSHAGIVFESRVVETETDFLNELKEFIPDIIISDYNMPQFNGMRALNLTLEKYPDIPFILLTGALNEETAVECIKNGANDYVIKEHITRLPFAVKEVLEKNKLKLEKNKIEKTLFESEERFRSLYENSTIGLYRTTPDGKIILANPTIVNLLGYSTYEELAERNLERDGFEPDYERKKFLEQIEMNGEVKDFEAEWTRKDGKVVYISESAKAIRDSNGKTLYYDGTVEDITERKLAEETLLKSKLQYDNLVSKIPVGIYILHTVPEGTFVLDYVSPKMAEMFNVSVESFLADSQIVIQSIHQDERNDFVKLNQEGIHLRRPFDWEGRVLTAKGEKWLHLTSSPEPLENGDTLWHGLVVDITERKRAEKALRESQQFIEGIINSISVRVFWKDKNLVYLGCNNEFAHDAGFADPKEIIGKDDYQMGWRDQAELYRADDRSVIESGKSKLLIEEPQTTPDGNTISLLTSKIPLLDSKGEIIGLLGTYIDITERKRAEEDLQNAKKYAENLIETANAIVVGLDLYGNITVFNKAAEVITGYTRSDLENKNWFETIVPKDRYPNVWANFEKLSTTEIPKIFENPILTKTGDERYITWKNNNIVLGGNVVGTISFGIDITENKKAEELLIASETRYRRLFESARDGILILDSETGKILDVNPSLIEKLGYSYKMFLDKSIWEVGFFKDIIINKQKFLEWQQKDYVRYENLPFETSDGRKLNVEFISIVYLVDNKKVIQCNIRDITARKRVEIEVLKLSQAVEQSPASIVITSPKGDIEYVNKNFCEVTGYTKDEVIGKNPRIMKSGSQDKKYYEELWDTILSGKDWKGELHNKKKNGDLYWESVLISPVVNENSDITSFIAIKEDITEQKKVREELQISEEKFRDLFEKMLDGFYKSSHEGKFLKINNAMVNMLGYNSKEELYAIDIKSDLYFEESERESAALEEKYEEMAIFRLKKKDGSEIWVEDHGRHVLDDKGSVLYHEGVMRDVTERLRSEQELIKAKEKAEEMNRLKSNFLANMSHELRTPLVGILGFADLLSEGVESQESKTMAETIYKSGIRLSETLNLILDLSKYETEKWDIKPNQIDLVSKSEEIINSFEGTAAKKGLSLKSSFSHHSIIINFDERAFHSILNNIINNALKYTNEGSVTTKIVLKNDFVEIEIIDTGIGISKQDHQIIFEEFRQASEGYGRNFEGTGLGLSITKKLVEKFGGTITVESEIGRGSTFKVILPVTITEAKENEIATAERKMNPVSPQKKSEKPVALLVDDDPFVFTVLKRYASEYIELETTVDADLALSELKKKQYDLIFMDINLKRGMDGKQATQMIRTMKGYESIPIIATTAYTMIGDKEEFLAAGCTNYLSKPFSREEIVSLLEEVLKLE